MYSFNSIKNDGAQEKYNHSSSFVDRLQKFKHTLNGRNWNASCLLPAIEKESHWEKVKKTFKLKWLVLEKVEKNCKIDRSTEKKIAENNNKVRMYKEKNCLVYVYMLARLVME